MDISSAVRALKIVEDFENSAAADNGDAFMYVEALKYLIDETGEAQYISRLGGYYYEQRRFDLALKYYEAAAQKGDLHATDALGYIWYYGRTGETDYEKAFEYYSRAAEMGSLTSAVKIADMYKNGYYVEKNNDEYKRRIMELYPKVRNAKYLNEPLPEVYTRLAGIYIKDDSDDNARKLLADARTFLEQRMMNNPFFGTLNQLNWLINDYYSITEFETDNFELYDLFHVLKKPAKVRFWCDGEAHEVEATGGETEPEICLDGKWYRSCKDFLLKAEISGRRITALCYDLYGFEVI